MSLGQRYLARYDRPMVAYMALQRAVISRYVRLHGGTAVEFVDRHHSAFRATFGWMLRTRAPS